MLEHRVSIHSIYSYSQKVYDCEKQAALIHFSESVTAQHYIIFKVFNTIFLVSTVKLSMENQ